MSRTYRTPLKLLLCSAVLSTAACATASFSPAPAELAPLISTLNERLYIADQVALTKWDSGKAIQDSPREQQVIAKGVSLAPAYKLDGNEVGAFLAAQIEANKLVQYALLAKWHEVGKAPNTPRPDLVKDIRPKLDVLQDRLLQRFAAFAPYRSNPDCPVWVNQQRKAVSNDVVHDLALLRAVGELCVSGQ